MVEAIDSLEMKVRGKDSEQNQDLEDRLANQEGNNEQSGQKEAVFELKHLKHVPMISWVMIAFAMTSNCCYYQLTNMSTDLVTIRFQYEYLHAKNAAATIPFLNIFLITSFIYLVTKYGKKTYCYVAGSISYLLCFISLMNLPSDTPAAWKVFLSLSALSAGNALIVSSVTAGILLTIPTKSSRFVVPIMAVGFNIPEVLSSPLMGYISRDRTPEAYQNCLHLLLVYGCLDLGMSLLIFYYNRQEGVDGLLDKPGNDSWVFEYKEKINSKIDDLIRGGSVGEDLGDGYEMR